MRQGVFKHIVHELAEDLYKRRCINICEAFIDGTFAQTKKRKPFVGNTKRGKGTKIMAVADASGLPVTTDVESVSPHEVKLVEANIESSFVVHTPERLIVDKAYDSDGFDHHLKKSQGIQMIAPHKENRNRLAFKTTANSGAISAAGRSNVYLPAYRISGE
jgi:hypothetical protein